MLWTSANTTLTNRRTQRVRANQIIPASSDFVDLTPRTSGEKVAPTSVERRPPASPHRTRAGSRIAAQPRTDSPTPLASAPMTGRSLMRQWIRQRRGDEPEARLELGERL